MGGRSEPPCGLIERVGCAALGSEDKDEYVTLCPQEVPSLRWVGGWEEGRRINRHVAAGAGMPRTPVGT